MHLGHVLFVDDDVLAQWTFTEVLNDAGFKVTSVCRVDAALRLLEAAPLFDLLLTEFTLPGAMTGVDLAGHWRVAQPGRPVIYATAAPRFMVGHLEDGEDFIAKPFTAEELLRVILEAMDDALLHFTPRAIGRRFAWVQ